MNAQKTVARKRVSRDSALQAEYRRNHVKIRDAARRVVKEYWGEDIGHLSDAILAIVRELIACRVTEVSDSDIDAALACVEAARHLVRRFKRHFVYEAYWREQDAREQRRAAESGAAMLSAMQSARSFFERDHSTTKTPKLSLVRDCGRDLAPRDPNISP